MAYDSSTGPIDAGDTWDAFAQAMMIAAQNANNAQQQSMVTAQAATAMGVATLYSIDTAAMGIAAQAMVRK